MDTKIVGFISLLQVKTLHYRGLWVDLIAVAPDYQHMDIATKLLGQGKQYSEELDVDFVSGLVAINNAGSQGAFKKSGFHPLEKDFNLFLWERKQ
jgi:ribosomal protein S18 acetylase RimI-like enzyme